MFVALVYNAKPSARSAIAEKGGQMLPEGDDEPPPLVESGSEDDQYAEWDDEETILAVANALATRHRVVLLEATASLADRVRKVHPDLVFNIAEGAAGVSREAQVPALLEMLGIPYTGSDPLTLALCLDKAWTKAILATHGVPTAPFAVVDSLASLSSASTVPLPAMVKPMYEGSSKGIKDDQLVADQAVLLDRTQRVLQEYQQPVLIEAFLPGREFTVGILGNGPSLRVLPPVEIRFDAFPSQANRIYSWEAKWVWDRPEDPLDVFQCPADLTDTERSTIDALCRDVARVLRIRDWARIDIRMDAAGIPNIIEINPLPGILPDPKANSCYPKAARTMGLSYDEMICAVADAAIQRLGLAS